MMQHRGNLLSGLSDTGLMRLARIANEQAAHRRWLAMASRRIVAEYPNQARWVCLRVMTGREKVVQKSLEALDIEVLVPMRKGKIHHRRGRVIPAADIPVLIGYALVRCVYSSTAMAGLKTVEHVIGILGGWETPVPISVEYVSKYKEKADAGAYDYERPGVILKRGERVRVTEGPFGGINGCVVTAPGDGVGDAVIEIVLMGKSVPMLVPLANIERL